MLIISDALFYQLFCVEVHLVYFVFINVVDVSNTLDISLVENCLPPSHSKDDGG